MTKVFTLDEFVGSQSFISRRELLNAIKRKGVTLNGNLVHDLSCQVHAPEDVVEVEGTLITYRFPYLYYLYHKPKGVLSTMEDPNERPCIGDRIREMHEPLFPVGRLDRQTSGLMILTNDGDLAFALTHPSQKIIKSYTVGLDKPVLPLDLKRLAYGIILEDGPISMTIDSKRKDTLNISITEGRNRIVRRVFESLGYHVKSLKRHAIDHLTLGDIPSGAIMPIDKKALKGLERIKRDTDDELRSLA